MAESLNQPVDNRRRNRLAPAPLRRIGVCGIVTFIAALALLHVAEADLKPGTNTISEYANAGMGARAILAIALLAWAASAVAAAVLARRMPDAVLQTALPALLFIAAVGLAVAAAFQTQAVAGAVPASVARTSEGRLHDLGAGGAQLSFMCGAVLSLIALRRIAWFRWTTTFLLLVAVGFGPLEAFVDWSTRGTPQRVLVAAACWWLLALISACHNALSCDDNVVQRSGRRA